MMLIFCSSIALFAQPSPSPKICYTVEELRAITLKLVDGAECDTLLSFCTEEVNAKDGIIATQSASLQFFSEETRLLEGIISNHEVNLGEYKMIVEEKDAEIKKLKLRFGVISIGFGAAAIYAIFKWMIKAFILLRWSDLIAFITPCFEA